MKQFTKRRWVRLLSIGCSVSVLSSCALSPTMVGHGRGEMRPGGEFPCGEASLSDPALHSSIDGNRRLKCAMSEASALRNDYLREIGRRDLVRNTFYSAATIAGAVIALNSIDEVFGPADQGHPAAVTAATLVTGFALNRYFNNPTQQDIYRAGAKAILCEQAVVAPYLDANDAYYKLADIMRGHDREDGDLAARLANARSAYRLYRAVVASSPESFQKIEKPYLDEVQSILSDSEKAMKWAAFFLGQVETDAPNRLQKQTVHIRNKVIDQLQAGRPTEADITAFIAAAPVQITSLLGSFTTAQSAPETTNQAQRRSERKNNVDGLANLSDLRAEARQKLEQSLALLEQDTIYIAGQSQSFTQDTKKDFERLEDTDQCKFDFDETSLGITLSRSTHSFTQGTASNVTFSVTHGQSPYASKLSSTDKGVTVDFNESTGAGVINYDGEGKAAEIAIIITEELRPSAGSATITVRIEAKPGTDNQGGDGDDRTNTAERLSKGPQAERMGALQRGLARALSKKVSVDGKFGTQTAKYVNEFRQKQMEFAPVTLNSLRDVDFKTIGKLLEFTVDASLEDASFNGARQDERDLTATEKQKLFKEIYKRRISEIVESTYRGGAFSRRNRVAIAWYQYVLSARGVSSIKISGILDGPTQRYINELTDE